MDQKEHTSKKGKLKDKKNPQPAMRLSTKRKAPNCEDFKPMTVKHRKFIASSNPRSQTLLAKFRRKKLMGKEAKQAIRQVFESVLLPIIDNTISIVDAELERKEQACRESEPLTRRRYLEETESLTKKQNVESKRKSEEQSLKGEASTRVQGVKVEPSKTRASSSFSPPSKQMKLSDADAATKRFLRAAITPVGRD